MRVNQAFTVLAAAPLLFAAGSAIAGTEVYSWVDADGVVHFSQWAPDDTGLSVSRLEIETSNDEDYEPDADPYSVLNQSARVHDRWTRLQAASDESREQPDTDAVSPQQPEYYFPALRFGHFARLSGRNPFLLQRRQLRVLDEFDRLPIPRASSINSSWHRARVDAQQQIALDVIRQGSR